MAKLFGKLKKGALSKQLGIPEKDKIPMSLINKKLSEVNQKLKDASGTKRTKLVQLKRRLIFAKNAKTKFK